MYNKIFTKILDSSIWLEPSPTRIVWLTIIAAMDEDGFAQFASPANLAHRARVEPDECNAAVTVLESPDPNSADPDNEGRRIERVPGGWVVLNAAKYRDLVTRSTIQEQTRLRVAKHRKKLSDSGGVCNAPVTQRNEKLTPSDTDTDTDTELTLSRPTLDLAKSAAGQFGVTEKQAEDWWLAREASDWTRGTAGGGSVKVGRNWQADMKSFTNTKLQNQNDRAAHRQNHKSDPANKPGRYA